MSKGSIHERAQREVDANIYTLDNDYLTRYQKFLVESWYQFPVSFFQIALLGFLILTFKGDWKIVEAVGMAYAVSIAVALINWAVLWKPLILAASAISGYGGTLVNLGFAAFFAYEEQWVFCGLGVAAAVGILAVIAPSIPLYTVLNREPMHPKYAFAKRLFGIQFPFET